MIFYMCVFQCCFFSKTLSEHQFCLSKNHFFIFRFVSKISPFQFDGPKVFVNAIYAIRVAVIAI